MPLTRELDPSAGPLQFFGAELRRARAASGLSQDQLGQRLGYSAAQVGKVETGERAPSQDFAHGCDQTFPGAGGLFTRIYQLARRWDGGHPSWFAEWVEAERRATSLCWWEPLLIPGLLQTADYARAILAADPETNDDQLEELVYMESPSQGQTTEVPAVVGRLSLTFDTLRADALPRGASRDLIGKVAEERWATT